MQEADTTVEWDGAIVSGFLLLRETSAQPAAEPNRNARASETEPCSPDLEAVAQELVESLGEADLDGIAAYWTTDRGVPPDLDRRMLTRARDALGKTLEREELRQLRGRFQRLVRQRLDARQRLRFSR